MRMKILLTNDDGIGSAGLAALVFGLSQHHEIFVAAPSKQQSAVSRCMTLFRPLEAHPHTFPGSEHVRAFSITGTPVDCVRLALGNLFRDIEFDLVLSGINHGPNVGTDILYSGTVAAAAEAALLGYPSVAVSINGSEPFHFESALPVVLGACEYLKNTPLPFGTVLNLNVPNMPVNEIKGARVAHTGYREYTLPFDEESTEDGGLRYWPPQTLVETKEDQLSDCYFLDKGYAVLTPVGYDLTDHSALKDLRSHEGEFETWKTC